MADNQEKMQALVDGLCAMDADSGVTVITSVLQARPEMATAVVTFAVPDLTYPPSRALIERRAEGTIKSFSLEKGFGFIDCQELKEAFGNDVFFHHSQLGVFAQGMPVSFAVMLNRESKPQAYDLQEPGYKGGGGAKGAMKGAMMAAAMGAAKGWGAADNGWGSEKGWGAGGAPSAAAAMKGKGPWSGGGMLGPGGPAAPKGGAAAPKGGAAPAERAERVERSGGTMLVPGMGKGAAANKGKDGGKGIAKGTKGAGKSAKGDEVPLGQFGGVIKSFNEKNAYGFIDCPEIKQEHNFDVFLHAMDKGNFNVGDNVTFDCCINTMGKPQARGLKNAGGGGAAKRQRTEGSFAWGQTW